MLLMSLGGKITGGAVDSRPYRESTHIKELVKIKLRYLNADPSLTVEPVVSFKTVVPYNLDAWDGYAV